MNDERVINQHERRALKAGVERRTFTVDEAAAVLGIGRNAAYDAVKSGAIPCVHFGRRILIAKATIDRLLGVIPP